MSLTPEQRSLRASIAGNAKSAKYDGVEQTAKARKTYQQSFVDQVDPDRVLPEAERERRTRAAYRAHMQRLALKSSRARAKRAER